MTTTPAQEAIAILIDLAQKGEINPWDVQVIDAIDRFLNELGLLDHPDVAYQQANLPRSGQAFLWASMLVLLKADTLLQNPDSPEEEEALTELSLGELDNNCRSLPLALERHLRRRTSAPPLRKRRVTLSELISQIEEIATELGEKPARPVRTPRPQSRREATRLIAQLAHQENLTEMASQLEQFFQSHLPHIVPQQDWIDLEELLNWWNQANSSQSDDRVGIFWALLLLSSQSKVELSQNQFYQDLKIQVVP
jgi:segregation and condensation protein A